MHEVLREEGGVSLAKHVFGQINPEGTGLNVIVRLTGFGKSVIGGLNILLCLLDWLETRLKLFAFFEVFASTLLIS